MDYCDITSYTFTVCTPAMADMFRLLLVVFALCISGILSNDFTTAIPGLGVIYRNGTSWRQARQYCRSRGSKLITFDSTDEWEALSLQLNNTPITSLWVGARDQRDTWMWTDDGTKLESKSIGCFAGDAKTVVRRSFRENQPTLCMSHCWFFSEKIYAALKGEDCYCYGDAKELSSLKESECNVTCPGNKNVKCGGRNSVTVYKASDSIRWSYEKPRGVGKGRDCAVMTVNSKDNQTHWYDADCQEKEYKYICKIETNLNICTFLKQEAPCFYPQTDTASWFVAAKKCKNLGGHLVGKDIEGAVNMDLRGNFYWTSLSRVTESWTNGKTIDPSIRRTTRSSNATRSCISIERGEDNEWFLSPRHCKLEMSFLCREVSGMKYERPSDIILTSGQIIVPERKNNFFMNGSYIFFIVVPCAFGVLIIFATVMLFFALKRCRKNEIQKQKKQQHFYFILEKEEDIYNTIDCVEHTSRPLPVRSTSPRQVCPTGSRVIVFDTEETYNKLVRKGRISNTWDNQNSSISPHDPENQYDHLKKIEHYDTIESVKRNCVTLVENPYDLCEAPLPGENTSSRRDMTSNKAFHFAGRRVPEIPDVIANCEENIYESAEKNSDKSNSKENLIEQNTSQ